MQMQQAEEILGMRFRGRKVYLEQKGQNKEQVDADLKRVRRDCLHFALIIKGFQESKRSPDLIIRPNQNCLN